MTVIIYGMERTEGSELGRLVRDRNLNNLKSFGREERKKSPLRLLRCYALS